MARRDPERPGPRRPGKDPYRTATFREAARAIVYRDRDGRRAGLSVDAAGAITWALERAYAQGFADAAQAPPVSPPPPGTTSDTAAGPVE